MTAVMPEPTEQAAPADPQAEQRAKIKKLRGDQYPTDDAPETARVAYVKQLRETGNAEALARYWQTTRNLCYANGRQRITWNKRQRQWEDLPRSETELPVEMNYIRPSLRARTQRMMSAPIDFSVLPDSNAHEAQDRAQVAARFFEARWRLTNMRQKLDQSLELAYAAGVTAWKSFWNPALGPLTAATGQQIRRQPLVLEDGQPMLDEMGQPATEVVYDEQGQPIQDVVYVDEAGQPVESADQAYHFRPGDTDTAVRTIFNLRLNPEATGWGSGDGLRWLIDTEVVPLATAKERFPEYADRLQADQQPDQALTFERIAASSSTQRPGGTAATASAQGHGPKAPETVTLSEYWELPSECYPDGRLLTAVGTVVVYDGPFPWGVFPYAPIFDEPAPLTPYGRPSINDAIRPQDVINRQWGAIDAEQQMAGIGQIVSWDVPNLTDQLTGGSRTIVKVPMHQRLMNKSIRDVFHRMEPAVASPDRWHLLQEAKTTLFDVLGFHEVTRGETPPGVDSGVAIDKLLEQEAGQLQKSMLALHESIVSWARQQLAIARWGYGANAARWMPVNREDLGYQVESVTGQDLPDPQSLIIELDNFKPHSETARRAEVMSLFEKQLVGPRQALKALDMGTGMNALLDAQQRHYARARNENLAIEKGEFILATAEVEDQMTGEPMPMQVLMHPPTEEAEGQPIPFLLADNDAHEIHIEVLEEIILDDTRAWAIRNAAMVHSREHRRVLMLTQQPAPSPQPQQAA